MTLRRRRPGLVYPINEDWHYVGDGGSEPAFQNSWANVTGTGRLAFRVREAGVVDVQGVISNGTDVGVFTLPTGYRPSALCIVPIAALYFEGTADEASYAGLMQVETDGDVRVLVSAGGGSQTPDLAWIHAQFFLTPPNVV